MGIFYAHRSFKSYGEQSIEALSHCVDLRREFCPERDVKIFSVSLKEIKAVEIKKKLKQ